MSEFDQRIRSARKNFFLTTIIGGAFFLILGVAAVLWIVLVRGYTVKISPQAAVKEAVMAVDSGVGFTLGDKLYAASDTVTLNVSSPTFFPARLTVTAEEKRRLAVELAPKPATVRLMPEPANDRIKWSIDDQLTHIGGRLDRTLAAGSYSLTIDSPYHATVRKNLELARAQLLEETVDLAPVAVALNFDSQPPGASVSINGAVVGETPLQLTRPAGEYMVRIAKPSFAAITEEIDATKLKERITRDYRLEKLKGAITVQARPRGGVLMIDGLAAEIGQATEIAGDQNVQISYLKDGFEPFRRSLYLEPGARRTLSVQLEPQYGAVRLRAEPKAQVVIDGRLVGSTPLSLDLPAMPHRVAFKREGYRTETRKVIPDPAAPRVVEARLLTELEARRAEGRKTFAEEIGIEMRLFRPQALNMGSPPTEKGRFRNEFERSVSFTRPFYLSVHEITQAQFARFKGRNPANAADVPVTNISWLDAARFCNWLSEKEGLAPFYRIVGGEYRGYNPDSNGYRLPTEAEWEWAARRARRLTETRFVWGNQEKVPENAGNFADKSAKGTLPVYIGQYTDGFAGKAPVGSFRADRAGLHDLAGNVSEWVHDRYTNRPPADDAIFQDWMGPARGVGRVVKGGNYRTARFAELRAAYRRQATEPAGTIGFRIARYD